MEEKLKEFNKFMEEMMFLSIKSRLEGKDTSKMDEIIEKYKHLYSAEN